MKTNLLVLLIAAIAPLFAFGQEIADVSDPSSIKLNTPDSGIVVCGSLRDCIANYPKLRDKFIAETTKRLEAEDEVSAVHRMQTLNGQKIELPKMTRDKHDARITKFAKAKEDALLTAAKKAQVVIKIDNATSQDQIDAQLKSLSEARALAQKAKAKKDELIAAGIPISNATEKAVEAVQARPTPAPPSPTPTPGDGL